MDVKSKANFINSITDNTVIVCPKCGISNRNDSQVCSSCGAELTIVQNVDTPVSVFQEVKDSPIKRKTDKYVESSNTFAQGLPEWNIEPPQIVVRRR